MKTLLKNPILILGVRFVLGGIFVVASLDKIGDPAGFANSILNYKVITTTLSTLTATVLPWLELLCGIGLIAGTYPRTSAILITCMLVGFTLLVASALIRGLDISCGCFTQDPNSSKIGWQKIFENCGMIILGIFLSSIKEENLKGIKILHFRQEKS